MAKKSFQAIDRNISKKNANKKPTIKSPKVSRISNRPDPSEYVNVLTSNFHIQDGNKLVQGEAYFRGGERNPNNRCMFKYNFSGLFSNVKDTIILPLPPTGVSFDYQMRTSVIDTYGGQVIQLLGVSIENLTITGNFGWEGMWGYEDNTRTKSTDRKVDGSDNTYKAWDNRIRSSNRRQWVDGQSGLVQLAEWFQAYFDSATQEGLYRKDDMIFRYDHRGWSWRIRPYEFPQVKFSNEEVAPQWQVKCDFVEDIQGNFIQSVTKAVKSQLNSFKDKVGFAEFIEWSEPRYIDRDTAISAVKEIAGDYNAKYLNSFGEKEVQTLMTRGYSFPASQFSKFVKS